MDTRTDPNVEVLTVLACPHRELALDRVRTALARVGAPRVVIVERVIDDLAAAAAAGMHGSPTVLIDGSDPFNTTAAEASVSCRLYPTAAGLEGAPTVEDLVVALSHLGRSGR